MFFPLSVGDYCSFFLLKKIHIYTKHTFDTVLNVIGNNGLRECSIVGVCDRKPVWV